MPLLIDGYNLLRTIQRDAFAALEDAQMCQLISDYLYRKRDTGKIVFDGIGPPDKSSLRNIKSLEVLFSGQHEADEIIEDLILDNTAPKKLTVVSSDRRVKAAAKKRKATAIRVKIFGSNLLNCWKRNGQCLPNRRESAKA